MKASYLPQKSFHRSHLQAALVCCLACLFAPASRATQGYTIVPASAFLNVYFNDGVATGAIFPTASPYSPPETGGSTTGVGLPLTSYGSTSWLQTGSSYPQAITGNWGPFSFGTLYANSQVNYQQGSYFIGTNNFSASYLTPYGTSMALNHSVSTGIAELRLDWVGTYNYAGPATWQNGTHYNVGNMVSDNNGNAELCITAGNSASSGSAPSGGWNTTLFGTTGDNGIAWELLPTYVPTFMVLGWSGNVGVFVALTAEETFTVNSSTVTVQVPWGGDFAAGSSALPPSLASDLDSTVPGVFGSDTHGPYNNGVAASPTTLTMTIKNNQNITVSGFIDLFVDPGSALLQILPVSPPALGITTSNNLPVVYFPISTATNYTLQISTNLVTGPWTAVTNGVPAIATNNGVIYGGLQITNRANTAEFFRLH